MRQRSHYRRNSLTARTFHIARSGFDAEVVGQYVAEMGGIPIESLVRNSPPEGSLVRESVDNYQFLPYSTKKLLDNVKEILESGNEVIADALKANIKAFLQAVRTGKKRDKNKLKNEGQNPENN